MYWHVTIHKFLWMHTVFWHLLDNIYTCMYVCMYVCIYIYLYIYIYTCTCQYLPTQCECVWCPLITRDIFQGVRAAMEKKQQLKVRNMSTLFAFLYACVYVFWALCYLAGVIGCPHPRYMNNPLSFTSTDKDMKMRCLNLNICSSVFPCECAQLCRSTRYIALFIHTIMSILQPCRHHGRTCYSCTRTNQTPALFHGTHQRDVFLCLHCHGCDCRSCKLKPTSMEAVTF